MPGRHRRPSSRPLTARAAAGVVGASALAIPLVPGAAVAADTPAAPDSASPRVPAPVPGPQQPRTDDDSHAFRGDSVVDTANDEYGKPYQWGGEGPLTYDCSGLTKHVYAQFGVTLPHNSAAQYQVVDHVSKSDMRRGDLVFFYDSGGIYHVGIYAGDNMMWAASKTGEFVHKDEIWTDQFVVGRP